MNERTLRILEFHKIIEQLTNEAATSLGKELATNLKPATALSDVIGRQHETDEAVQLFRLNKEDSFSGIFDIRSSIHRSSIGGILNEGECLEVAQTIRGGMIVKQFIETIEDVSIPILQTLVQRITALRNVKSMITTCIDDSGIMMD